MTHISRPHVSSNEKPGSSVPGDASVRRRVRELAAEVAGSLPTAGIGGGESLDRATIERLGREVAERAGLCACMATFCAVAVGTAFWSRDFAATGFGRRLLLLPHCLRDMASCRATRRGGAVVCGRCMKCAIGRLTERAEQLGYQTLVAEGMPDLVRVLIGGGIDAMLGVACLDSLEESFVRVQNFGMPFAAVPLLRDGCSGTEVELEVVEEIMESRQDCETIIKPRLSRLLSEAGELFEPRRMEQLLRASGAAFAAPAGRDGGSVIDQTEKLALEWLGRAGKRFRPFITLAAYDALRRERAVSEGNGGASSAGGALQEEIPDFVRAVALAMEAFHKASLAHDDVEDDDLTRYGQPTLYADYGAPTAINVGDYLVGLGYRIVSGLAETLGAEVAGKIISCLSESHLQLCQGQGAELFMTGEAAADAAAGEVLKLYALKTAPAFTAAMLSGLLLAGGAADDASAIRRFCRHLGVGYQVLDDLEDWRESGEGRRGGDDFLGGRPTILLTFAVATGEGGRLRELLREKATLRVAEVVTEVREIFARCGAFDKARRLVDKCRQRAVEAMNEAASAELRRLMSHVLDLVMIGSV